jgi:hypothetical protein
LARNTFDLRRYGEVANPADVAGAFECSLGARRSSRR